MFTFEEARELIILVFWLMVLYKLIPRVIVKILEGLLKKIVILEAKQVTVRENQVPQSHDTIQEKKEETKKRTIGFKSNND